MQGNPVGTIPEYLEWPTEIFACLIKNFRVSIDLLCKIRYLMSVTLEIDMRFFWILCCPLILLGVSHDMTIGLRALQQIRTLIPERLSDEEFTISVDRKAFIEPLNALATHSLKESAIPSAKMLGHSHFYYSHWTISGEPVRILDFYQEFEYGPYWLYPTAMERLRDMHHLTPKSS